MDESNRPERVLGFRRYFVALAVAVVLLVTSLGVVVGTTAQTEFDAVRVLHVLTIRPTPVTMGALAGGIAVAILLALFALLRVVSRYDDASRYRE